MGDGKESGVATGYMHPAVQVSVPYFTVGAGHELPGWCCIVDMFNIFSMRNSSIYSSPLSLSNSCLEICLNRSRLCKNLCHEYICLLGHECMVCVCRYKYAAHSGPRELRGRGRKERAYQMHHHKSPSPPVYVNKWTH